MFAVWTFFRQRGLRVHHQRRDVRAVRTDHRLRVRHRTESEKNYDNRNGADRCQLLDRRTCSVRAARKVRTLFDYFVSRAFLSLLLGGRCPTVRSVSLENRKPAPDAWTFMSLRLVAVQFERLIATDKRKLEHLINVIWKLTLSKRIA